MIQLINSICKNAISRTIRFGVVFVLTLFTIAVASTPTVVQLRYSFQLPYSPNLTEKTGRRFPALGTSSAQLLGGYTNWLQTKTEMDSTSGNFVSQRYLKGKPIGTTHIQTLQEYKQNRLQIDKQKLFTESVSRAVSSYREIPKEALEIQIPLKVKSKVFNRIFGGDRVGLRVNGELSINGEIRKENTDRQITQQGQQAATNFKIDQRQRFTITGNIGDKVSVRIDQDSERLFEFENAVKLEYTGNEDEIIQKIEAGNISLELPGTQLAAFSGQNKGLFGLKSIAKVGPLKLTTIASLEKGKKNKLKISNGEQQRLIHIQDINFINGQYFALDSTNYLEVIRSFGPNMSTEVGVPNDLVIRELYVYVSQTQIIGGQIPIRGYAMAFPPNPADFDTSEFTPDNRNNFVAQFIRLNESDYTLDINRGLLVLKRPIQQGQVLAVAYRTDRAIVGTQQITEETPILVLKLLRGQTDDPQSAVWNLTLRNYYSLQGSDISKESFEATIYRSYTNPPQQSRENVFYSNIFGMDNNSPNGTPVNNGDGLIDVSPAFIDLQEGTIRFPDLTPFSPTGYFVNGQLVTYQLDSIEQNPLLYRAVNPQTSGVTSKFYIEAKVRSRSNTLNLGIAVLENSEEVTLNGTTRLVRGRDYTIDYFSGTLSLLDPRASAPGAEVDVTYESGQIFQLDRKTLLGVRAEYELWDESFVGFTFLSLNEKPLDKRIRLGSEPISNRIWDVNTRLVFKPTLLTKMMDALPIISTEEPSRISIEGEIAQVFPNPNSMSNAATGDYNGIAYVDDFESAKRSIPLSINRTNWQLSAFPKSDHLHQSDTVSVFPARDFRWYNPFNQTPIKDIWPNRDVNSNVANTTQTLVLELNPKATRNGSNDTTTTPRASWGAVTRYLGGGYANQQEAKFIEIWLKKERGPNGKLFIDLGRISEDVIPDGRDEPSTEDNPIVAGTSQGDGILTAEEDRGLDRMNGSDPFDYWDINRNGIRDTATFTNGGIQKTIFEPLSFDDYVNESAINVYTKINGTEGNRLDEGGYYPDTEDLNGNGVTDKQDEFYRFVIEIGNPNSPYIAGGRDNPKGWYLYRIPIADTLRVNNPDLQNIFYTRIGLTEFSAPVVVNIAEINIVGNEWRPPGPYTLQRSEYSLEADVINSIDNYDAQSPSGYVPPPGVSGEIDPITEVRQKEQSLRIRVNQLRTGETSYLVKQLYEPINLLEYRRLKLFVHGGAFQTKLVSGVLPNNSFDRYRVHFKLRLGIDSTRNYYEISKRIYPGWDARNHIDIQLEDLPTLKYERGLLNTGIPDTTNRQTAKILADGTEIKVVGNPTLQQIRVFGVVLENRGIPISEVDKVELWIDELRVTDVKRTPGMAYRLSSDVDFAKIVGMRFQLSQTDGNFHNVNVRTGTKNSTITGSANANFKVDEFFPNWLGITFPLATSFSQTISKPEYLNNGDISLDRLAGKTLDIWNPFWKHITTNRMLSFEPGFGGEDTLLTFQKQYSFGVSGISRTTIPVKWWEKWFANRWTTGFTQNETYSASPTIRYQKLQTRNTNFGYNVPLEFGPGIALFSWTENIPILKKLYDSNLGYSPNRFSISYQFNEQTGSSATRERNIPTDTWSFGVNRSFQTGYRMFENWSWEYGLNTRFNAIRTERDRVRIGYSSLGYDFMFNDTSRYRDSLVIYPNLPDSIAGLRPDLNVFKKTGGYYLIKDQSDQSISSSWSPSILSWLGTEYRYASQYSWSWGANYASTGRGVASRTNADQTYTLRLKTLFGREGGYAPQPRSRDRSKDRTDRFLRNPLDVGKEEQVDPLERIQEDLLSMAPDTLPDTSGLQRGRGRRSPQSTKETLEQTDSLPKKKTNQANPLHLLGKLIDRMDDISISIRRNRDYAVPAVQTGQADWRFQLGLTSDPKLRTMERVITRPSARLTRDYESRSGLKITQNITVGLDHKWSIQEINQGNRSEVRQKSAFLLSNSDGTPKQLDLPNFSIRWSGLEKAGPWKGLAQTVTLENAYQAGSTTNYGFRQNVGDSTQSKFIGSIDYTKNWNPLVGINISWKNRITTTARYTNSSTFNDSRQGREQRRKSEQTNLQFSAGYTWQKGFRIPIKVWPFNNKQFKNQSEFTLTFTQSETKTESADKLLSGWSPFVETAASSTYTLTPKFSVTFSRSVTGNIQYEMGATKTKGGASTKINALKFNVNIQIRG